MVNEYKQSEIGSIPETWECVQTKKLFANHSLKNHPNESLLSVTQDKGVIPRDLLETRVTMPEGDTSNFKLVEPGDFVISLRSFQGGIELSNYRGLVSPAYTVLRKSTEIEEEFYKHLFKSNWFINRLSSAVIGIRDGKQISYSVFSELYVPQPSIPEQRKIAAILKSVDDAIASTQRIIDQTKIVKRGLMQQLLTKGIGHTAFKQTEIGEIPTAWDVRRLEEVTTKIGDGIHGTPQYDGNGTIPFINGNNIKNKSLYIPTDNKRINEVEYTKYVQYLNEYSIFLSINGTIGNLGFYNGEKVLLGKSIAYINPKADLLARKYLLYYLGSHKVRDFFTRELTGTTIKNLSLKTIRETLIPVPTMDEQNRIASVLSTFDDKIDNHTEELDNLFQLKLGLMQALLTGKVRVNAHEPSEVSV